MRNIQNRLAALERAQGQDDMPPTLVMFTASPEEAWPLDRINGRKRELWDFPKVYQAPGQSAADACIAAGVTPDKFAVMGVSFQ